MEEMTVKGIITGVFPHGEKGKRIAAITDRLGRVTAFAGGNSKSDSGLSGILRPFTCVNLSLKKGKSAYNLKNASAIEAFEGLLSDPDKYIYASYVLETGEYFSAEGMADNESVPLLNLMYVTLKAISDYGKPLSDPKDKKTAPKDCGEEKPVADPKDRKEAPPKLGESLAGWHGGKFFSGEQFKYIIAVYELRLLKLEGEYTLSSPENADETADVNVLWRLVLNSPLTSLYENIEKMPEEALEEFAASVRRFFLKQVKHRFKSLKVLEEGF